MTVICTSRKCFVILPVRSHPTIVRREAGGRPKEHRQAQCWSQRTQRPVRYHSETREQRRLIRGRLCRRPQPRLGSAGVVQSWSLSGSGEPVLCVRAQKTSLEVGERNQADRCGLVTWIRGKQCWDCGQLHSTFTSLSHLFTGLWLPVTVCLSSPCGRRVPDGNRGAV